MGESSQLRLIHAFTTLKEGLPADSNFDLDAKNCHNSNSLLGVATDIIGEQQPTYFQTVWYDDETGYVSVTVINCW
jgi:hypothetical protein